jgi:hypothetical protein
MKPYTADEINLIKPKPKITYSIRIGGYHSAIGDEFDNITDARIHRINLIRQARKSNELWFEGEIRPYYSPMHKIKNAWLRLSMLYCSKEITHYYWKVNRFAYNPKIYREPIKTISHIENIKIA